MTEAPETQTYVVNRVGSIFWHATNHAAVAQKLKSGQDINPFPPVHSWFTGHGGRGRGKHRRHPCGTAVFPFILATCNFGGQPCHLPNGLMLSATELAMCSLEITPTIADGRYRPPIFVTTAMLASWRATR